jgi:hypothetical protein
MQDDFPDEGWYWPAEQLVWMPLEHDDPGGQIKHDSEFEDA